MPSAVEPGQYKTIISQIIGGHCVPFLGAGVNVSSPEHNYNGLPLAYDVALHMVEALTTLNKKALTDITDNAANDIKRRLAIAAAGLNEPVTLTDEEIQKHLSDAGPLSSLLKVTLPDLARIALHVREDNGSRRLLQLIHEVLPDEKYQPSPLLKVLASLPIKLFVTANYDRLLERALEDRHKDLQSRDSNAQDDSKEQGKGITEKYEPPYELVVQSVDGFSETKQQDLQNTLSTTEKPIIYKIHGSFSDKGPERLILTEEDYIAFLSVVGRQDVGVPTLIKSKMSSGTILFLGYSLQDWDFRTIYKTLIEPLPEWQRPTSYAIQKDPPEFWKRYWGRKDVIILDTHLYDFASELQQYWDNDPANKGKT